jgi:hypothetical protein
MPSTKAVDELEPMFIVNIKVFRREEDGTMSGQRRWIKVWARTVGMPVGATDTADQ